jgi:hypothetical protein
VAFYDLRGLAARLRGRYTPDELAARTLEASLPVRVAYWPEFGPPHAGEGGARWCGTRTGRLELVNHHDRPLRVILALDLKGGEEADAGFIVTHGTVGRWVASARDGWVALELTAPPGRLPLTIVWRGTEPQRTSGVPLWFSVRAARVMLHGGGAALAGGSRP